MSTSFVYIFYIIISGLEDITFLINAICARQIYIFFIVCNVKTFHKMELEDFKLHLELSLVNTTNFRERNRVFEELCKEASITDNVSEELYQEYIIKPYNASVLTNYIRTTGCILYNTTSSYELRTSKSMGGRISNGTWFNIL